MPWRIEGKYLVNTITGKKKNKKPMSKKRLREYQKALYANVPEAKEK